MNMKAMVVAAVGPLIVLALLNGLRRFGGGGRLCESRRHRERNKSRATQNSPRDFHDILRSYDCFISSAGPRVLAGKAVRIMKHARAEKVANWREPVATSSSDGTYRGSVTHMDGAFGASNPLMNAYFR